MPITLSLTDEAQSDNKENKEDNEKIAVNVSLVNPDSLPALKEIFKLSSKLTLTLNLNYFEFPMFAKGLLEFPFEELEKLESFILARARIGLDPLKISSSFLVNLLKCPRLTRIEVSENIFISQYEPAKNKNSPRISQFYLDLLIEDTRVNGNRDVTIVATPDNGELDRVRNPMPTLPSSAFFPPKSRAEVAAARHAKYTALAAAQRDAKPAASAAARDPRLLASVPAAKVVKDGAPNPGSRVGCRM